MPALALSVVGSLWFSQLARHRTNCRFKKRAYSAAKIRIKNENYCISGEKPIGNTASAPPRKHYTNSSGTVCHLLLKRRSLLLMLSLFKREYPKGEGVVYKNSSTARAVPLLSSQEEEFICILLLLIRRSRIVAKPQD